MDKKRLRNAIDQEFMKDADKVLQNALAHVQGGGGYSRSAAVVFLLNLAKDYHNDLVKLEEGA